MLDVETDLGAMFFVLDPMYGTMDAGCDNPFWSLDSTVIRSFVDSVVRSSVLDT